jgi:soluble lytic murein transglycosylase
MGAPRPLVHLLAAIALCSVSCDIAERSGDSPRIPAAPDPEVAPVAEFLEARHTGLLPAEVAEVAEVIVSEARRAGLSPRLVMALIHVESSGYNFAVSHAGAVGLMQLRPATAAAEAGRAGVAWRGPATLFDPVANVRLGVSYLARLVERYGDVEKGLAAYNWGPSRVSAFMRRGEDVPSGYAQRVLANYRGALSRSERRI